MGKEYCTCANCAHERALANHAAFVSSGRDIARTAIELALPLIGSGVQEIIESYGCGFDGRENLLAAVRLLQKAVV